MSLPTRLGLRMALLSTHSGSRPLSSSLFFSLQWRDWKEDAMSFCV